MTRQYTRIHSKPLPTGAFLVFLNGRVRVLQVDPPTRYRWTGTKLERVP